MHMKQYNIKRVSLICIVVLLTFMIPAGAAEKNDAPENYPGVLTQLGIISAEQEHSDDVITRADFCVLIAGLISWGTEDSSFSADRSVFSDVSRWDWSAGYLQYLADRGWLSGYDDGSFRPDDPISFSDAYSVILKVLGYGKYIDIIGTGPESIMKIALETGLDKNPEGSGGGEQVTYSRAAVMLTNMLDVRIMEYGGAAGNVEFKTGGSFLNEYMGLCEKKGVLNGDGIISTLGTDIPSDSIEIDGKIYLNETGEISNLLGCGITFYCDELSGGGGSSVYAVIPESKNNILELDSREVISYDGSVLTYMKENGRQTAKIGSRSDIIYNGVWTKERDRLIPEYGSLRLIDNDNDRYYDTAIVCDYKTIIVNTVDTKKNIIHGKNPDSSGANYRLELDDFDRVIIMKDGKPAELGEIISGAVLSAQMSEGKYLFLNMSLNSVTGSISRVMCEESDGTEIEVNGKVYKVAYDAYTPYWNGETGDGFTISVDFLGNAAAIMRSGDGSWKYGYVIRAGINDDAGVMQLKMLTDSGKITTFQCTENVKIDGASSADPKVAAGLMANPQLIRYKMKGDSVGFIDIASEQSMDDFTDNESKDEDKLLLRAYDYLQFKKDVNTFKRIGTANVKVSGEIIPESAAPVFCIPIDTENADDSDYRVIARSGISADKQCYVQGYNTAPDMLKAQAVVMFEDKKLANTSRLFIVDTVRQVLTADNEVTYRLQGYSNGTSAQRTLKSSDLITLDGHTITQGDVIRTRQNNSGLTTMIELIYTSDGKGILNTSSKYEKPGGFDSELRLIAGRVINKSGNMFMLKYESGSTRPELFQAGGFSIFVYDSNAKATEAVYIGTTGDIPSVEPGTSSDEKLIVSTRNTTPLEIIVLK